MKTQIIAFLLLITSSGCVWDWGSWCSEPSFGIYLVEIADTETSDDIKDIPWTRFSSDESSSVDFDDSYRFISISGYQMKIGDEFLVVGDSPLEVGDEMITVVRNFPIQLKERTLIITDTETNETTEQHFEEYGEGESFGWAHAKNDALLYRRHSSEWFLHRNDETTGIEGQKIVLSEAGTYQWLEGDRYLASYASGYPDLLRFHGVDGTIQESLLRVDVGDYQQEDLVLERAEGRTVIGRFDKADISAWNGTYLSRDGNRAYFRSSGESNRGLLVDLENETAVMINETEVEFLHDRLPQRDTSLDGRYTAHMVNEVQSWDGTLKITAVDKVRESIDDRYGDENEGLEGDRIYYDFDLHLNSEDSFYQQKGSFEAGFSSAYCYSD